MRFLKYTYLILAFCIGMMYSCRKAKLNKSTTTVKNYVTAQYLYQEAYFSILKALNAHEVSYKVEDQDTNKCETLVIDVSSENEKVFSIDYGASCTDEDELNRKGKIIAVLTGEVNTEGSTLEITFEDFYINHYKVEGTEIIKYLGNNADSILVENGLITLPNNTDVISWECLMKQTKVEGTETTFSFNAEDGCYLSESCFYDDVYQITGYIKAINQEGRLFDAKTTQNLIGKFCDKQFIISQGKVDVQPENLRLRAVNFGDGDCNNDIEVTVKKKTSTLSVSPW